MAEMADLFERKSLKLLAQAGQTLNQIVGEGLCDEPQKDLMRRMLMELRVMLGDILTIDPRIAIHGGFNGEGVVVQNARISHAWGPVGDRFRAYDALGSSADGGLPASLDLVDTRAINSSVLERKSLRRGEVL